MIPFPMQKHSLDTIDHPMKERFLNAVPGRVDEDLVEDHLEAYVLAAEHSDGEAFWDYFSSPMEAIRDFKRFVEFRETNQ